MSDELLTHEEHMARATLLGRIYDWRDGTYYAQLSLGELPNREYMLCCVTLEPVDWDQAADRRIVNLLEFNLGDLNPFEGTPWARANPIKP